MKAPLILLTILTYTLNTHAQQPTNDYKTMLDSAISIKYAQLPNTANSLYLLDEQNLPLNTTPPGSRAKFINIYDSRNIGTISKGIYAWKVSATMNKNRFIITIIDYYITYKNPNYNFANAGSTRTIFEYSCEAGKWRLISTENHGV